MEFEASTDSEGRLFIKPNIERKANANGGEDVIIHMPNLGSINKLKKTILIEKEKTNNGKRSISKV